MTEKEDADTELRMSITDVFMKAARIVLEAVDSGPPQVVLAVDDAMDELRTFQNGIKAACREVRNSSPPARPRPESIRPSKSGTMPSPSEGAARNDWHLPNHTESTVTNNADAGDAPLEVRRLSTIRPPPPDDKDLATAATDPAPPRPAKRPRNVVTRPKKAKPKRKR